MMTFYRCNTCGNLIEMIDASGVTPVCCGKPMEELIPKAADAAKEKHVPVIHEHPTGSEGCIDPTCTRVISAEVGEIPHPMNEEHWIQWILLLTDEGIYRKPLNPSAAPKAEFLLHKEEKILAVYEYCSLHGLWVNCMK